MTDDLRYWYEHELTRLRASERAGFNVTKEMAEVTQLLSRYNLLHDDALARTRGENLDGLPRRETVTVAVRDADDVLPTDWTTP